MPRNSPTYGLPMLSSSATGVHSPEKSIWANAGTLISVIASSTRAPAIVARLMFSIEPSSESILHAELNDTRRIAEQRATGSDLAERRAVERRGRLAPLEPVEGI